MVDDDPSLQQLIADYLSDEGIRVTAVASGREIAQVMSRETIDLLILELHMPGEDGMHIVRRLREECAIPIIILSRRRDEADRVMGLELGADDYVTKPFSPRELLARIRALLRRSRAQRTVAGDVARIRAYRFLGWEPQRTPAPLDGAGRLERLFADQQRVQPCWRRFWARRSGVLSREQLLSLSRLHDDEVYDRAIDVQVGRLSQEARARRRASPAHPHGARCGLRFHGACRSSAPVVGGFARHITAEGPVRELRLEDQSPEERGLAVGAEPRRVFGEGAISG